MNSTRIVSDRLRRGLSSWTERKEGNMAKVTYTKQQFEDGLLDLQGKMATAHKEDIDTMDHLIGKYQAETNDLKNVVDSRNKLIREMAKFIAKV
jgi:ATP-dependent helicase YprA (DUF1998 family)